MQNREDKLRESEALSISLAYRGQSAKADAEQMHDKLQASGLAVEPLSEIGRGRADLGAAEIIITIMVTAAAKAVITTALKYVEDYIRERTARGGGDLNLQVVLQEPSAQPAKRFPFSFRRATVETVTAFSESIREAILKL